MVGLTQFLIICVVIGAVLIVLQRTSWVEGTVKLIIQVVLVVVLLILAIRFLMPMAGLG